MEGLSIMIKLTFKHLLVVSMILTLFLGLSLVSATDVTDDNAVSTKNICTHSITSDNNNDNIDVNDINNYVKNTFTSTSANSSHSDENIIKENDNNGNTVGASNGATITELKNIIDAGGSSIILTDDYTYSDSTDSGLIEGIIVSRDLTIDGQGHTIDLGGQARFIQSNTEGINLVFKNLIIKNGYQIARGGAVYIENGNGNFINSTFTDNYANTAAGGAIYINGSGSFINSTFTNNNASYGGAIYIKGNGSFINSTFTNNTGGDGGAIYIEDSSCSFINSTFTNNNAYVGGSIHIEKSNCSFVDSTFNGNIAIYAAAVHFYTVNGTFVNCTFTANNATSNGGVVYITNSSGSFINSTFTNNNASYGGAIYIEGNGSFIKSTFINNKAKDGGGAIYIKGNGSFINSTFTNNNASYGGAVNIYTGNGSFINSTFINNTGDDGGAVNIYTGNGSFINSTFTNNNAYNGGAIYIKGNGSFINSTFTNNNASYGGAIHIEGNGSFIKSTFINNKATNGGGAVNIYTGSGSFINSTFTSNNAIMGGAVNMENGSFINSTFTNNNAAHGGAVLICGDSGSFINSTFINNTGGDGGAIYIEDSSCSFINSVFTGNNVNGGCGGAIFIDGGSGSFINSEFTNNNATKYPEGAIFIDGGSGSFINSEFTNNNALLGGAVYMGNGSFVNCTLTYNNANYGGAVYIGSENRDYIHSTFSNCSFTNNNATEGEGGVLFINGNNSFATFINSSFNYNINPLYATSNHNVIFDQNTVINSDKNLTNNTLYMNASVNNFTYGSSGFINITLFNDERIVSEGVVFVIISNKTYAANVSDNNVIIYLPNVDCGVYELNIIFNGTDNYFQTYVPINFTVNKQSTSINAKAATYIVNYGGLYKVIFNPKTAGFKVSFKLKGKNIGHAITDVFGIAKINIKASTLKNIGAGTHTLVAQFAGDKNHNESKTNAKLTIKKEATKFLNVKSVKKYYKSTAKFMQLAATLKNSKNKAIKNQWIYFKVNNKKIYKVKTDSKGLAKLILNKADIKSCKINKKGVYRFTVSYKGSDNYKSNNKKGLIKVF